jgi:hypothetical protein
VPVAWKTASNVAVKFEPRSRIRNLMSANRWSRFEGEVACLLHGPAFGSGAGSEPGMIAGDVMPGRSQAEGRPTRRLFTVDLVG